MREVSLFFFIMAGESKKEAVAPMGGGREGTPGNAFFSPRHTPHEITQFFKALNYREPVSPKEPYKERLLAEEGRGLKGKPGYSYMDTADNLTIGIGHKVEKGDKKVFQKLFGKSVDYEGLTSGKKPLTNKQMETLLDYDIARKLKRSESLFPNFNKYSSEMKATLLDGVYRGDLSQSPKAIKLINQGKFKEASKEYLDHDGYRRSKAKKTGIYKRMDRNAEIISKE